MTRLAVLGSGVGSILDAILDAGITVDLFVSDRHCLALERAGAAGVKAELVERTDFTAAFDRDAYTAALVAVLQRHEVDVVAMAGFGTVVPRIVDAYGGRVLNTHPALLPAFRGWHAVRDALAAGVKVTGCTIHLVDDNVDEGVILAQEAVRVLPDDDEATLHERIKAVERSLYPTTIDEFLKGFST